MPQCIRSLSFPEHCQTASYRGEVNYIVVRRSVKLVLFWRSPTQKAVWQPDLLLSYGSRPDTVPALHGYGCNMEYRGMSKIGCSGVHRAWSGERD